MFAWVNKFLIYAVLGLAAALIALAGYHWVKVGYLNNQITAKNQELVALNIQVEQAVAANLKLADSLRTQNEKIKELVTASEETSRLANQAIAKAQQETRRWRGKYQQLWNTPRPSGDDCKDLTLKIDQYIAVRTLEGGP